MLLLSSDSILRPYTRSATPNDQVHKHIVCPNGTDRARKKEESNTVYSTRAYYSINSIIFGTCEMWGASILKVTQGTFQFSISVAERVSVCLFQIGVAVVTAYALLGPR